MANKKSGMSLGKLILTIATIVLAVATCLPLFVNVWNGVTTYGDTSKAAEIGGYFEDYSPVAESFKLADATFMDWASMIAGIALIVALVGAALYIVGAIMSFVSNGKLATGLCKIGAFVMLVAGVVVFVASLLFVLPTATMGSMSMSTALGFGAWVGFLAPIGAGVLGIMANRK